MTKSKSTLIARARAWTQEQGLHGPHAFLRYVMFVFVEALNEDDDREFVLKGGNLLWVLIRTPRSTVDLDFVTRQLRDHQSIKRKIDSFCKTDHGFGLTFQVLSFEEKSESSAAATIGYQTSEGQRNKFDIDLVYALETDVTEIPSPLDCQRSVLAATLENIVADKLAAANQFAGGNTRMKDFDDLWRISRKNGINFDWIRLREILSKRQIPQNLNLDWIHPAMIRTWNNHRKRSQGLPESLERTFQDVNQWLASGLKQ